MTGGHSGVGSLSILIVEDHPVLATSMAIALEAQGIGRVQVAAQEHLDPEAVLAAAEEARPDIVLLDLHLGDDRVATPLVAPLRQWAGHVVILTGSHDLARLGECLRAGAEAVLDKAMPFDRLVNALQRLGAGERLMEAEEREALIAELDRRDHERHDRLAPFERLTEREAEVLRLLIDGRSPKEIARAGGISVSTVRGHIQRVLHKLDVSNQRAALALARHAGWPPDEPSE
jgi:DNA-binding NarL/FixJ family response regulator